ncbi:PhzF family phenazine biosynthesis protein [Moraxella nasovis]|uniref:PhzF family phenazine biosynthesis protein n=1 Tax=Moraxella nasovis TaxID=2904121 RepID=UPI001F61FD30|nr:PhzF family phenazine biosynthesis protein [Moraxella nasovis]UNU73848.1 PhzF family phenazine biosynthesis protein [Moraxella nasovis]
MTQAIPQFIIDAFTDSVFGGNPAAVCLLDTPLPDETLQNIAKENNLSETAYILKKDNGNYHLRWFTPTSEIDLCGHATLASAFVLFNCVGVVGDTVKFDTLSGELTVQQVGVKLKMTFPAYTLKNMAITDELIAKIKNALGDSIAHALQSVYLARDLLIVVDDEKLVRECTPDFAKLTELDGALCHITAPSHGKFDCVSRSFAPKFGINEDPVCGAGHCHIVPFWSKTLGKVGITAYQASERGGILYCNDLGERVELSGQAVMFGRGKIYIGAKLD